LEINLVLVRISIQKIFLFSRIECLGGCGGCPAHLKGRGLPRALLW